MLALRVAESVQGLGRIAPLLWVQKPGNGRVSLKAFPADADDARPAGRGIRPMTGSNCSPAAGSKARKWKSEFKSISS